MTPTASTKYQFVRNQLEEAIRSGELTTGDQLPAEQTLADRYGVSLMTARKVVCDLVAADLLERRARKGTFVREHAVEKMSTTTVNLIVVAYDTSFQRTFLNQGIRQTEARGWHANVIRLAQGQQDAAVRALQNDEYALLMIEGMQEQSALALAVRNARGRVVSLGWDLTKFGVPTIYVKPERSFGVAFEHLWALGHRDIYIIDQNLSESYTAIHTTAWRAVTAGCYSGEEANARFIHVQTPRFSCPSFDSYDAIRKLLADESRHPTAIICFGEEITQGVLAACRAAGQFVPDDISLINILDAPSMVFTHPSITSVDVDFERQVQLAFELWDSARSGQMPEAQKHTIEPLLLERESVTPAQT